MDLPFIRDIGLGFSAVFCGIVAIINGNGKASKSDLKDKVNTKDCLDKHESINNILSEGNRNFGVINERLKNIQSSFENFYSHNDRRTIRLLDDLSDMKERLIKVEINVYDFIKKNGDKK